MLWIICAILIRDIIVRCVNASGLQPIGQILVLVLIVILLGGISIGSPETAHYFSLTR